MQLFGYEIKKKKNDEAEQYLNSPIEPEEDGASNVSGAGAWAQAFSFANVDYSSEADLIKKYRSALLTPEVESAVDQIVNDAIITDESQKAVQLEFEGGSNISSSLKKRILEEFDYLYNLLNFQENGYEYFRSWYVDGRLAFYKNVDTQKKTIRSIQTIDPLKIKKIKEIHQDKQKQGVPLITDINVYYEYARNGFASGSGTTKNAVHLTDESVTYVTSGLLSDDRKYTLSHLHKAIKPINQLNMMEDAIVIYRISRAPERRIFYIDVGNLPRQKAEQYVKDIMNRYRNKLVYDPKTGEINDKRKYQTMLEDYWLPRREGGRGTQVDTLPAGQAMNQIEDLEYFLRKVYKALNVPFTRFQGENPAFAARATEVTRDELNFARFVQRLRSRFAHIFYDMLKTQLILKKIINESEWTQIKNEFYFDFNKDSYFQEAKDAELLQQRMQVLRDINEYRGTYFSTDYIMKNVLRMSEDEIKEMREQIDKEKKSGIIPKEDEGGGMF